MRPDCLLAVFFLIFSSAAPAGAVTLFPAIEKAIPAAEKVGEHSYSVLFTDVYDIALYAPSGLWSKDAPHALSVRYHLSIDSEDLIERSIVEMQRQDLEARTLARWKDDLTVFMPDVEKDTILSVLNIPGQKTVFYKNGAPIGTVKDPSFGQAYLGIWLAENTSEPEMRAELLGRR